MDESSQNHEQIGVKRKKRKKEKGRVRGVHRSAGIQGEWRKKDGGSIGDGRALKEKREPAGFCPGLEVKSILESTGGQRDKLSAGSSVLRPNRQDSHPGRERLH